MIRSVAVGILVAGLAAACGGSGHSSATTGTTAPTTVGAVAPSSTTVTTSKASSNPAVKLYDKLVAAGLPVKGLAVYDASTDPNHILGRPGQYTAKIAWVDTRTPSDTWATDPLPINAGGSIEVFGDKAAATARAKEMFAVQKATTILGVEYDYLTGDAVIRVSGKLTPDQAAEYGKATGATLYTG